MKPIKRSMLWIVAGLLWGAGAASLSAESAPSYHVAQKIAVPGDGGWDALTIDAQARRLYISHSTLVQILDIDQGTLVGQIPDTPGVHQIALAPELGRGFTSNGKESTVTIFELKSGKSLDRVKVGGENPDAILYDPASRRVIAFNGRSSNATLLDAATGKVFGQIALDGKPEFSVADGKGNVFVNLEDKSMLVSLDPVKLAIKTRWPLAPCQEPSGLAIDVASNRLFAACGNKVMVVVDAATGRLVASLPIGEHVDGAAFNPATHEIFSSNGEGTLTVIHEDSPDVYHVTGTVQTEKGARTVALDEKTHRLYLATAQFGPPPAPTPEHPKPRPSILPGTFTILVVAP